MGYKIDWIIPGLRRPSRLWYCASTITVAVVGLFSKIIVEWLNKTTVYNRATMIHALECRAPGVPLLTVSNHHSCFDDPGLWGVLDLKVLCSSARMRWSLAAHDICFTNSFHSYFFMFGKCVPVVRGEGVYQTAMDFCLEQLNKGKWVHIFPEGKVNMSKEFLRFKWGVGRLIYECPIPPVVLPVWHEGMDSVLPNVEPYLLKFRKRVFLNFGDPIQITDLVDSLKNMNATPEEARKAITDRIQHELYRLRDQTHALIRQTLGGSAEQFLSRTTACPNNADERKNNAEEQISNTDERLNSTDEWINKTKERINNTEEWINNTNERINNTDEWINNTKERINNTDEWINNTKERINNKERKENGVDRDTSDSGGKGHLKQS